MKPTILVTGGAGYIGAHVCKALHLAGYQPIVIDNLSTGHREFVRWGPLIEANVSNTHALRSAFAQYRIRGIIDLAGAIEVGESMTNPLKYYANNLADKLPLIFCAQEAGIRAYVFSSSAAVYGEPQRIPITETHPLQPKNPYGRSKQMLEQVLSDNSLAGGLNWIALRYFNAAGASADNEIGEAHNPETHLIPRACMAALGHVPALEIFGIDYPTPDGTAVRDFVHVEDLADAHVRAIGQLLDGAPPATYNLGNGLGISVQQILQAFAQLGWPVPHEFKPRREGDPAWLVADATQARIHLGWSPYYTNIADIIRSAYRWHAQRTPPALKIKPPPILKLEDA